MNLVLGGGGSKKTRHSSSKKRRRTGSVISDTSDSCCATATQDMGLGQTVIFLGFSDHSFHGQKLSGT